MVRLMLRVTAAGGPARQAAREHAQKAAILEVDRSYFASYSHFGIHREMLSDRVGLLVPLAPVTAQDIAACGCMLQAMAWW